MGLGNNFAFQCRNFSPESANTSGFVAKAEYDEYNLLYKLDSVVSAFAGFVTSKSTSPFGGVLVSTDVEKYWQASIISSTQIAPRVSFCGIAAAGEDLTNLEAGISYYQTSPQIEFNYRDFKAKRMTPPAVNIFIESKATGYGSGLIYNFQQAENILYLDIQDSGSIQGLRWRKYIPNKLETHHPIRVRLKIAYYFVSVVSNYLMLTADAKKKTANAALNFFSHLINFVLPFKAITPVFDRRSSNHHHYLF